MLNTILETKRAEITQLEQNNFRYDQDVVSRGIAHYPFIEKLKKPNRNSALIAEVKKASPSKGVIREDFQPVQIAKSYVQGQADCLSVLTDVRYFQGNPSYIAQIKEEVVVPILRKDFIIESIQLAESVQLGADAVLLIAKALPVAKLFELYREAESLGLDCLVEVATAQEIEELFSQFTPKLIGINNRDLHTFVTDIQQTIDLLQCIPKDVMVISESGIDSAEKVQRLEKAGVAGFLIGEFFMRQENIVQAMESLYA